MTQPTSAAAREPGAAPLPAPVAAPHRIALFTHDTFGLGHVRRSLHIVRALAAASPRSAVLFITGSPALKLLEDLPPNTDFIKIPTVAKTGSKGSQPPHLPIPTAETALLRERLIRESVLGFAPDVLVVDNFPLGSQRELLPTLIAARRRSVRTVLGLRDILDAPEKIGPEWERQGMHEILERYYDRVLVYGMREVFAVEEAYAFPPRLAARVRYCGYVTAPEPLRSAEEVRAELGVSGPFLLATGGGGGDGYPLLHAVLGAMPHLQGVSAAIVTGPLMSAAHQSKLRAQADGQRGVVVKDYAADLTSYMAAADLVVSMCGYNIASEIVALRARAVVVPRTWRYGEHANRATAPEEWEQMLRAQALARLGFVELLEPEALNPEVLARRIREALERPRSAQAGAVDVRGLEAATRQIFELCESRREVHGDS
jgi:predicted glycosyltransferase